MLGFVQLALRDHTAETTSALEREVMGSAQVLSCHNLSGRYDYQLEVVAAEPRIVCRLRARPCAQPAGVREISTSFAPRK